MGALTKKELLALGFFRLNEVGHIKDPISKGTESVIRCDMNMKKRDVLLKSA